VLLELLADAGMTATRFVEVLQRVRPG
jgi:hypothetical protein